MNFLHRLVLNVDHSVGSCSGASCSILAGRCCDVELFVRRRVRKRERQASINPQQDSMILTAERVLPVAISTQQNRVTRRTWSIRLRATLGFQSECSKKKHQPRIAASFTSVSASHVRSRARRHGNESHINELRHGVTRKRGVTVMALVERQTGGKKGMTWQIRCLFDGESLFSFLHLRSFRPLFIGVGEFFAVLLATVWGLSSFIVWVFFNVMGCSRIRDLTRCVDRRG